MLLEHSPNTLLRSLEGEVSNIQLDLLPSLRIKSPKSTRTGPPRATHATTASSTIRRPLSPGLALVHANRPPVQLGLIHFGNGFFGRRAGAEGDEAEATGAGGAAFHGEENVGYGAEGAEYFAEAGFVGGIIQVANIELDLLSTAIATVTTAIVRLVITIGTRRGSSIVIVISSDVVVVAATVGGARTRAGAGTTVFGHDCYLIYLLGLIDCLVFRFGTEEK